MSDIGKYTLSNVVATLRNGWRKVALVPLTSVIIYYSDSERPKARKLAREKRMEDGRREIERTVTPSCLIET